MKITTKLMHSVGVILTILAAFPCLSFGQWVPLGPYGGGTQVLTNVPEHPGTLIAGTRNALLYRSKDGAASWHALPFPRALRATLNVLILDPCNPLTMYAGVTDSNDLP